MFSYQAYGLNITSEIKLPELITGGNGVDLTIRKGSINPPELEETSIQRQGIEALFGGTMMEAYIRWPGVATFLVRNGCELIVDMEQGESTENLLSLFVLSEALGIVLCQRGHFLLHASAVVVNNKAIIFAGKRGAGKSTTAAAFAQNGYPALTDDMVVVAFDAKNKPVVLPGFPQIKIWPESVHGLGYVEEEMPALFLGSKKRVIRDVVTFPKEPIPLSNIFIIENDDEWQISQMPEAETLLCLVKSFPCPSGLIREYAQKEHFKQCLKMIENVKIRKLKLPRNFKLLGETVRRISEELCFMSA